MSMGEQTRRTPPGAGVGAGLADTASFAALVALGLGSYLGWQTIGISPTLFPAPLAGADPFVTVGGYLNTVLFVALLVVFARLARTRGPLLAHPWIAVLTMCATALATATLYLCGWLVDATIPAGVVAGQALFGMSAGFVVLWGELLCHLRPARILTCVAAAYAVAFGICLVSAGLSPLAAIALRCVLPLLSGGILLALGCDLRERARPDEGAGRDGSANHPAERLPLRLFAGIGVFGCIFTVTNHLSETKTAVSTELYTLIAGIAVSLVIFALALATRRRRGDFSLLYRLMTPLVIGCLTLTLILEPGYQRYEALAIGCAWAFFRIFTWTLWAHVGLRDAAGGARAFAFGQIALSLGGTAGEFLFVATSPLEPPLVWAAAAIIFATVVTSTLVMNEGSVARLVAGQDGGAGAGEGALAASGTAACTQEDPAGQTAGASGIPAPLDPNAVSVEQFARATHTLDLSEREREIALLVLRRLDNPRICDIACITESTLRTHLRNIYGKLGVHSREELIELLERAVREEG